MEKNWDGLVKRKGAKYASDGSNAFYGGGETVLTLWPGSYETVSEAITSQGGFGKKGFWVVLNGFGRVLGGFGVVLGG